ncbi:hypothetical protein GIB67_000469 [Kingdonia uniflora]|uniref:non-specific serine/threonine protein kinase n=1 Tax=Kingdonia uniflora TaxID=39325 RepID=A0A7J7L0B6_9MAGN|nr:hypothetical protein GIB67_000469 [Kingdonia uniflora]
MVFFLLVPQTVRKAESTDSIGVTSAAMLDTGNFVLSSEEFAIKWACFDIPTDTILPTQKLNPEDKLSARLTENDFSRGRFELILQGDGNLVLYQKARPTGDNYDGYWDTRTTNGSQLIFNQSGYIYLSLGSSNRISLTPTTQVSPREFYHRATLDFDGVFRHYTYPKNSTGGRWRQSWSVSEYVPSNICTAFGGSALGSGVCGFNSYCKLDDNQRPQCNCPPRYTYIDSNNTFNGSAIIREGACWLKKFPLSNGKTDPTDKGKALIKKRIPKALFAVKRLESVVEGVEKEFRAEMSAIGRTNHKNLVQLLGFCDEGVHRLLVYEFMKNGSLASFLFGGSRPDWYQRIQIPFGIARGIVYLHEECSSQIIHCDIKPQNIPLDDSFNVKISDFGLAKLLMSDQSRCTTDIRGTRGYVAPEWKNIERESWDENTEILSDWAYDCCVESRLHLLVENDEQAKNDGKMLERLVMTAIWCIQEDPSLRPSMKKVAQMLGAIQVCMPPDPSSFISSICAYNQFLHINYLMLFKNSKMVKDQCNI